MTENKQTFDLKRKIEIEGKTRENAENKQNSSYQVPFVNDFEIFPLQK